MSPVGISGGNVEIRRTGFTACHGECANGRDDGIRRIGVNTGLRASRGFLNKKPGSNNQGFPAGYGVSGVVSVHVRIGTHALLDASDIQNASGAVRTLLPGAGANEEDRDEGEQDEDDDRQFEEGHAGLALDGWSLC